MGNIPERRPVFLALVTAAVVLISCEAWAAQHNVLSFGAAADGTTDCTQAFQQALDKAGAEGGGIVYAPAGKYRFDGNLEIPYSVTLQGDYTSPSTWQPSESIQDFGGTVFMVYSGRGSNEEPAFIRLAAKMATLRGVLIRYPDARYDEVPPVPYPPAILMNQWVTTVEDVCLTNAYEGIRIREGGRHLVRNVHGYPTWRGIYADWVQDVGRIENVHFSPMGFDFEPEGPYMQWIFKNGVAFEFAQSDWQYVLNTFCFGYDVGYKFSQSERGHCNGNFVGIAADCCRRAILVENCARVGVLILNGEFVGQWGPVSSIGVDVLPTSEGTLNLTNCSFFGPLDRAIRQRSEKARLVVSSSNFEFWDTDGDDSEAIEIESGRAIIQSSFFREARSHIRVGRDVEAVTVVGNQARTGINIHSEAGPLLREMANETDLMEWPKNGQTHYRVDIGSPGDSRYMACWGTFGKADEWSDEPKGTRRWSRSGSRMELPVTPGKSYSFTLEAYVPEEAVHPGHGVYLSDTLLAPLEESGFVTLHGEVPPQEGDSVVLELRGDHLPKSDDPPLFQLFFAARAVAMRAEGASDRICNANTGEWLPQEKSKDGDNVD